MKNRYYLKSVFTLVLFAASIFAFQAKAEAVVIDGVAYDVLDADAKTAQVVALPGGALYTGTVTIAAEVTINSETYAVKKIGNSALRGDKNGENPADNANSTGLTNVIIPEGVEIIGNSAFARCELLVNIALPSTVNTIEDYGFFECRALEAINLDKVTAIGEEAFNTTALKSVVLAEGLTVIRKKVFFDCKSLESVIIPDGVTKTENEAFRGSGVKSIELPASLTEIGGSCFEWAPLESINLENVTSLGGWSLARTKLTSVVLPEGITIINGGTFNSCDSLESITIPSSVTKVDAWAFQGASNLKEINVSWAKQSDVEFDYWAFGEDNQRPNYVWKVDYSLTAGYDATWWYRPVVSDLGEGKTLYAGVAYQVLDAEAKTAEVIALPEGAKYTGVVTLSANVPFGDELYAVKKIGDHSMRQSGDNVASDSLVNVIIPEGLEIIGNSAFASCDSLKAIVLPASVNSIEDWAFYGCKSLTTINIPEGVTIINGMTFSESSIETITIPNSVTKVNAWAFQRASNLKEIYVSWAKQSDVEFDYWAFGEDNERPNYVWKVDYSLAAGYDATWWYRPVVSDLGEGKILYAGVAYQVLDSESKTAEVIALPKVGEAPGEGEEDTRVRPKYTGTVTLSANVPFGDELYAVKKIGDHSMRQSGDNAASDSLVNVIIPEGLEIIGNSAFASCDSLKAIVLPASVNTIEDWAFYGCSSLASVNIPDGITAITEHTFQGTALTSIELPASVTSLKACAFQDAKLESINLENITEIGGNALTATAITTANLEKASIVGGWSFQNCTKLQFVTLSEDLAIIDGGTFSGCSALDSLVIPSSVTMIKDWSLEKSGLKEIFVSWENLGGLNVDPTAFGQDAGKIDFVWKVPSELKDVYGETWLGYPVSIIGGGTGVESILNGIIQLVSEGHAIRIIDGSNLGIAIDIYAINGTRFYTNNGQIDNTIVELPAGVYIVKITSVEGVITSKVIVK